MIDLELIRSRHSVRNYLDRPIEEDIVAKLQAEIDACNEESGLNIQLFTNEPEAFNGNKPRYGRFSGCKNYLAMIGPRGYDEKIGFFGERLVLLAQDLGLNSCWVALTFRRTYVKPIRRKGDKLYLLIALGYGADQGKPHVSRPLDEISNVDDEDTPDWFKEGMEAVSLAPTAMNQQQFFFQRVDKVVAGRSDAVALCDKIDLGIAKYHFEVVVGKDNFIWA
ncbi:MAG: nitroreductase [Clostridia bacterium]|nr:nitroreductase [Clostridia bacterium]